MGATMLILAAGDDSISADEAMFSDDGKTVNSILPLSHSEAAQTE
jgi:hypothetical protein